VVFVGDDEIREVHRRFFGVDTPTDVVAFPLHDGDLLGEVVVSVDTARSESRARGLTLARELALYAIHGVLHVLGYDHDDRWERRQMRRMEREYLDRFPF
jgi:rRNA maturation RNase YbeY